MKTRSTEPKKEKLITTILKGMKTTPLKIKYANIFKPYYYPNSPSIPRYSITLLINSEENAEDYEVINKIERSEGIEILKDEILKTGDGCETTENFVLKLQTKDEVEIYELENGERKRLVLNREIPTDKLAVCTYDILRYTKRGKDEDKYGLTCKLIEVELRDE